MDSTQNKLSASDVASQFLLDYYGVLRDTPTEMHKFYKDNSVFSGESESEKEPYLITGPQNIETKILSLVSSGPKWKLQIETVHAQESTDDSVLLIVRGNFSYGRDKIASRSFIQTFVLARQGSADSDVAFYVRNDVFLFISTPPSSLPLKKDVHVDSPMPPRSNSDASLSTEKIEAVTPVILESSNGTPQSTDATAAPKSESTKEVKQVVSPAAAPSSSTSAPSAAVVEASAAKDDKKKEAASSAKPVAATPAAPMNWADRAKKAANLEVTPLPPQARKPKETKPQQKTGVQPGGASTQEGFKPESTSTVCARNIPFNANQAQVDDAFKIFGEIKSSQLLTGYAFIDFASAESAQKAIQAKVVIGDREIRVEEKLPRGRDDRGRPNSGGRRNIGGARGRPAQNQMRGSPQGTRVGPRNERRQNN